MIRIWTTLSQMPNQEQINGYIRIGTVLICGFLAKHGIESTSGTQELVELLVAFVLTSAIGYWSHRSNTPAAMLNGAVKASQGSIIAMTSPLSSDTTITIKKPADVPVAVVATVQPKTP